MTISKEERERIRMMFGGRCSYCGIELPAKGWQMDHVEPVVRCYQYGEWLTDEDGKRSYRYYGNSKTRLARLDHPDADRKDNLWPCCRSCNINKSSMRLEQWRKFLAEGPESLASYNGRFRHLLRFGIVTINPAPFLFWFEKYQRDSEVSA